MKYFGYVIILFLAMGRFVGYSQSTTHMVSLDWNDPITERVNSVYTEVVNFTEANYESQDQGLPSLVINLPFTVVTDFEFLEPVYGELDFFPFERTEYELVKDTIVTQEDSVIYTYDLNNEIIDSSIVKVDKETIVDVVNEMQVADTLFERVLINAQAALIDTVDNIEVSNDEKGFNSSMKVLPFIKTSDGTIKKLLSFKYSFSKPKSSVLSSGQLYKIAIGESGVYKIDRAFLKKIGVDVNSIDPRKIKIYGNGGGMLPQANADFRFNDVTENPIEVIGEGDGVFNNDDYILFYGKGQHKPEYDVVLGKIAHHNNIYSDQAYYFLSVSGDAGLRVGSVNSESSAETSFSYFDDYQYHEEDNTNLIISGRDWVGEKFSSSNSSRSFSFSMNGLQIGTPLSVTSVLVSTPTTSSTFNISVESQSSKQVFMPASVDGTYGDKAREVTDTIVLSSAAVLGNLNLRYTYGSGNIGGNEAYMNRIEIRSKKRITPLSDQTFFRVVDSKNTLSAEYRIVGINANYEVWDVSDVSEVSKRITVTDGSDQVFRTKTAGVNEYLLFNKQGGFNEPSFVEVVGAQDLHSITSSPEMIIIAPPLLLDKAREYASLRSNQENIQSLVVDLRQVYNEFSSGAQDISAIRDFVRMMYHRSNGGLKYLLLFGDASYDYKSRLDNNTNLVPTYQAPESYQNVNTYASDDYFGFMEEGEGAWIQNHTLDIGVGRFPISTEEEADIMIDKVTQYVSASSALGKWRTNVTFVADDDDNTMHMDQANQLAEKIDNKYSSYNTNKIYLDAFEQIATPSGKVSPNCADELDEKIEKGSLIVNYTGHGSETQWTKEEVMNTNSITKLRNFKNLPLFVTATCEFGRYDDPALKSGAEELLLNAKGGAIGMLTTTRPVYALSNFAINGTFYDKVFEPINDTLMPTLGQVIKVTKNNSFSGTRNRNFTLLGDPSLTLAYPNKEIAITKINGKEDNLGATISALGLTTIKGEVRYFSGKKKADFNGEVAVTVYDKESKIRTLGDEGYPYEFKIRNNVLYEGKATVSQGDFEVSFVVPKDISYQFDEGKISLYAQSNDLSDAAGANTEIVIGGTDNNAVLETIPPVVSIYLDDKNFKSGDVTNDSPLLIADIFDENGINVSTSGLGHEMIAIIDGDESNAIILNDFYSSNLDNYKSGQVEYPFKDLLEGKHTLTVRAWDTHNNVGEATITFEVSYSNASVYAYPNPMSDFTTIMVEHSREGQELELTFEMYNPQGESVMSEQVVFENSDGVIEGMTWDGKDEFGVELQGGVYYYRITIRYPEDNFVVTKVNRLVLIN